MEVKSMGGHEKGRLRLEALVLPKISLQLRMQLVHFDPWWKHLRGVNFGRSQLWDSWQGGLADWSRCLLPNTPVCIAVWSIRIPSGHQHVLDGFCLVRKQVSLGLIRMFAASQ